MINTSLRHRFAFFVASTLFVLLPLQSVLVSQETRSTAGSKAVQSFLKTIQKRKNNLKQLQFKGVETWATSNQTSKNTYELRMDREGGFLHSVRKTDGDLRHILVVDQQNEVWEYPTMTNRLANYSLTTLVEAEIWNRHVNTYLPHDLINFGALSKHAPELEFEDLQQLELFRNKEQGKAKLDGTIKLDQKTLNLTYRFKSPHVQPVDRKGTVKKNENKDPNKEFSVRIQKFEDEPDFKPYSFSFEFQPSYNTGPTLKANIGSTLGQFQLNYTDKEHSFQSSKNKKALLLGLLPPDSEKKNKILTKLSRVRNNLQDGNGDSSSRQKIFGVLLGEDTKGTLPEERPSSVPLVNGFEETAPDLFREAPGQAAFLYLDHKGKIQNVLPPGASVSFLQSQLQLLLKHREEQDKLSKFADALKEYVKRTLKFKDTVPVENIAGKSVKIPGKLHLTKIHRDAITKFGGDTYFACVDFKAVEEDQSTTNYDLDFFMQYRHGSWKVDKILLHKVDGKKKVKYRNNKPVPINEDIERPEHWKNPPEHPGE